MADEAIKDASCVVGPGKPPKHTQFPKGVSGNKRGRPRGSVGLPTLMKRVGDKKIPITEGGQKKRMTREQYILHAVVAKAMKGDLKAADIYFRETGKLLPAEPASRLEHLVPDLDLPTKRMIAERMLREVEELEAEEAARSQAKPETES
jgi:hypothetical protein